IESIFILNTDHKIITDPLSSLLFVMYIEVLTAAIRQNESIIGIQIGSKVHKLALYADIIIYLTKALKDKYKFNGEASKVKYIGVYISNNLGDLFELNYGTLEKKLRMDMNRWKLFSLGILSRIEIIKMMVLPQYLFLFQAIPISLSRTNFYSWNRMIADFIWNNRKHRIKFKLLLKPKEEGGLGLPNLQNYFYTTQILIIIKWMNTKREPKWTNIERALVDISLRTLPFLEKSQLKKYQGQNFCVLSTLKSWKNNCRVTQIDNGLVMLREMRHDPDLIANKLDKILEFGQIKG
uniref:Reverse transcriptase domain-containing protein n=1 Tax=Neogobius melanostomus TaxID=47308 RepID=A0A8C6S5B8_9GOBI